MFCFSAAAKCPGEAASIHWEGVQEIGWNYELLGEPNWIEDMSAQMDAFVTAGIEGIEVVQGRPNILSPLIIHTFPTEWFPAHVMSEICHEPDNPNIHVTGIVFVPRTPCRNWMSQAFSTNPIAPNDVFYSPWKPKVKECNIEWFCTGFHIPPYTLKNSGQQSKKIQQKHLIQDFNTEEDACFMFGTCFSDGMRLWRCDIFTWPNATFYGRSTSFCESLQESYLLGSPHCFTGSWHFSEQPMVALWIRFQIVNLEEERFNLLETKL